MCRIGPEYRSAPTSAPYRPPAEPAGRRSRERNASFEHRERREIRVRVILQVRVVPWQMAQPQQRLRGHARSHQAMVADTDDGIGRWHRTGLAPVELHRLEPCLRVSVIVQDCAALLDA